MVSNCNFYSESNTSNSFVNDLNYDYYNCNDSYYINIGNRIDSHKFFLIIIEILTILMTLKLN